MDLVPDVSVAEGARASGSMEIYEAIMRNPIRYRIMNAYTREIALQNPTPAFLNDDTAIVYTLDIKQGITKPRGEEIEPIIGGATIGDANDMFEDEMDYLMPSLGIDEEFFNVTEDMNVREVDSEEPQLNYLPDLLSQYLPVDLP